jgi:hypothetical protein
VKVIRAIRLTLLLAAMTVPLSGCHKSLEGNYRDDGSIFFIEFKPGGKALVKIAGDTQEATFTVEGNKVILKSATGTITLTINDDGSLSGAPSLGTLKKRG